MTRTGKAIAALAAVAVTFEPGRAHHPASPAPAGLAVVNNETGAVIADYPYPNPPGGSRTHGVFYVPQVLR